MFAGSRWAALMVVSLPLFAQPSLKTVPVPQPVGLGTYVRDTQALTVLGKALFWDMQVGSDGRTACATCHFHAGADHRSQHQIVNPKAEFPLNVTLAAADFPFHVVADATLNTSQVLRDSSVIYGSAGAFRRKFSAVDLEAGSDDGFDVAQSEPFTLAGLILRQVTTRNAPSVINAVFNARNFWDGRARNQFNGANPFGASDTESRVLVMRNNMLRAEAVLIGNASLASQAVGPPMSSVEMAYEGLNWKLLGQRLLQARPLAKQRVAGDDSVLGAYANPNGTGLLTSISYGDLVRQAFQSAYWESVEYRDGFSQAESNFALLFGLALQQYQSTLVSDDSPFDRFAAGDANAMTQQQIAGLNLFRGRGRCNTCHTGAEFTQASRGADAGFFRTGVSPIDGDAGFNGLGAFKTPGLRNVELTGPYFHNGGQATLEQVVEFYNRGGDYPVGGVGPNIRRLNLNANERASLVAFMKALTDERVRWQQAPFDHPELCVPNGHTGELQTQDSRYGLSAEDRMFAIPAVGRSGAGAPLQTFIEMLETGPSALTQPCKINLSAAR